MIESLLSAAMLFQTTASAPVLPVAFAPDSDFWNIGSTATGTVTVSDRRITVALDDYTLTANGTYPDDRRITGYTVCLARMTSDDAWDTAGCAPTVEHKTTLHAGQSESVGATTLTIRTGDRPSLRDHWLVLRVQVARQGGGVGYVFADSQEGVFAPLSSGPGESGR